MLSVTFPISGPCELKEYVQLLYRQGDMSHTYAACSTSTHFNVVDRVFRQAEAALASQHYDLAYVKFARGIHIIDEEKLRERLDGVQRARVREILKRSLDAEVELRERYLPRLLEQQNTAMMNESAERSRIIALQMEPDVGENEEEAKEMKDHELRRQQLLGKVTSVTLNQAIPAAVSTVDEEGFHQQRQQILKVSEELRVAELQAKLVGSRPVIPSCDVVTSLVPALPKLTSHPESVASIPPSVNVVSSPKQLVLPPPEAFKAPKKQEKWVFESGCASQPRRGLVNLGNTCYMNSVVQCISQTELGFYVTSDDFVREILDQSGGGEAVSAFSFLMRELRIPSPKPVNAAKLKLEIGRLNEMFADKSQQDANEFCRTLLDAVHEDINTNNVRGVKFEEIDNAVGQDNEIAQKYWEQYRRTNASIVVSLFCFQERNAIWCPNCRNNPRSFNATLGIEVPIPSHVHEATIEDCLAAYCKKGVLDADSLYHCGKCKQKVPATTQLSFHTLPRNLIITLKRFRSNGNFSDKVQTPVAFFPTLDLKPFVSGTVESTKYKLVGVVNHQGNIHGGHYTADCMGMQDGLWFNFSDETVKPSSEPNFKLAYMLFFLQV